MKKRKEVKKPKMERHDDVKADKKLIKKEVKKDCMK